MAQADEGLLSAVLVYFGAGTIPILPVVKPWSFTGVDGQYIHKILFAECAEEMLEFWSWIPFHSLNRHKVNTLLAPSFHFSILAKDMK